MLFNSIDFAVFLPVVFIIYWFIVNRRLSIQNFFLVVASYFFYGWWDWRFLALIVVSSSVDYIVGICLGKVQEKTKRKMLLIVSIAVNIGLLATFKYYNFFAESLVGAFTLFGKKIDIGRLQVVLPVGISFYTFQTLSYSIDIFRNKLKPTKDIIAFFAYVSFFPQLVAGPIERAGNLLPQFLSNRNFNYEKSADGIRQILWGLFKKMVVADNLAALVDRVFNNPESFSSPALLITVCLFSFQIYCDFSGYSDIAIGTARLFGFDLMRNFAYPYFSRNIGEFWRRWHISLTGWFRDYIYIPLGGSREGQVKSIRNIFIVFLISGFWHGANWTFILWGGVHACLFVPAFILKKNRLYTDIAARERKIPSFKESIRIIVTFLLVSMTWIFFRSADLSGAVTYLKRLVFFWKTNKVDPGGQLFTSQIQMIVIPFLILMVGMEWLQRKKKHALEFSGEKYLYIRRFVYAALILGIYFFSVKNVGFIYFQF